MTSDSDEGAGEEIANVRFNELLALGQDARCQLVKEISAKGFEPGCWLRVNDGDLRHSAVEARDALAALGGFDALECDLSELLEFDGEHPWDPPADGQDAWIVISQSCDLIRDVADEPFVQLALLREAGDGLDLASLWRNSARLIPVDPTGKSSRYYVDLRSQALLAKHLLAGVDARQAIPTDADFEKRRPRTRFALRVGQRYSRMGIPTSIVETIVRPIEQAANSSRSLRTRLDEAFSEWLLVPGEQCSLIAVTPHPTNSEAFRQAEDLFFTEFGPKVDQQARERLNGDQSQVISLDDLLLTVWMSAWKLDLDFLTYGAKGAADSPEPHA